MVLHMTIGLEVTGMGKVFPTDPVLVGRKEQIEVSKSCFTCLFPAQVLCCLPCVVLLILGMVRGDTGPSDI